MRFGVLGPVAVWTCDGRPVAVPEFKVRALLADLLLHPGRPVSVDRLVDDLWGDDPPVHPAAALQSKVSRLRQALDRAETGGRGLVATQPPGYLLTATGEAVDMIRFAELADQAQASESPGTRASLLGEALSLWRGPALADFADEDFAQMAIARLEERRLTAMEDRAEARLALGEHGLLAGELAGLVTLHPLRERLRTFHMLALYRAGRQGEALESYRDLRGRLVDELGVDPGPDVAALHKGILEQDPALLGAPARLSAASRPRTNVPAVLTSTIGRADAIAEVKALLRERRLVTLTGPGGVGKTRLALVTASELADIFPDGTWLVELAAVAQGSARSLAESIRAVLGIREDPAADLAEQLTKALRASRMLLILDNCEHLIENAAEVVSRLLLAVPGLCVLVTSREPLALTGEVVFAVPPLELPGPDLGAEPDAVGEFSAVQLFNSRAIDHVSDFCLDHNNVRAVAELCRRLDGIPLALELAAARVPALGVQELLARLDDRFRVLTAGRRDTPARHQTLWAVIEWSWQLLSEPERLVLRRLTVAAGSCSLASAEAICAEGDLDIADVLARLVDRSLVQVSITGDGPRYQLLESVAAYARERLCQAGELPLLQLRHRRYFADLAQHAEPLLRGHDQRPWLGRLDVDTANLDACLDSAIQSRDSATALGLVNALTWYWFLRGQFQKAQRALASALALEHGDAAARATAAAWRSGFSVLLGQCDDPAIAARLLDRNTNPAVRATAEWFLGFVSSDFGDPSPGEEMINRALADFKAAGDQWGIAAALSTRAKQALIRGDRDSARHDARRSLTAFRALGDLWGQLQAIEWLGAVEAAEGGQAQAVQLHREGLRIAEELGLWPQAADALSWLGRSALQSGDLVHAHELLERAKHLAAEHSYKPGWVFAELGLGQVARREGKLDLAETHLRNVLQKIRQNGTEPDVGRVICLSELALITEERGDGVAARAHQQECCAAAR